MLTPAQSTPTLLISIAAVAAMVSAGWNNIKGYLSRLSGFAFHRIALSESAMHQTLIYLHRDGWVGVSSNFRKIFITSRTMSSKKSERSFLIESYVSGKGSMVLIKGFKILSENTSERTIICHRFININRVLKGVSEMMVDEIRTHVGFYMCRVTGKRFILDYKGDREHSKSSGNEPAMANSPSDYDIIDISTPIGVNVSDFKADLNHTRLDNMWLDDEARLCIRDAKTMIDNMPWFREHGVPWRFGFLFYGRPGTGKTKLAAALAEAIGKVLQIFDLSSMTNEDLVRSFHDYSCSEGRVVLFEDVDAVFNGRVNTTATATSPGVTFDCLLNVIDGADTMEGTILIITTNHIDRLDEALVRSGRIDRRHELKGLSKPGRIWMAEKILGDFPRPEWIDVVDRYGDDVTGAEFQEACCRIAMNLFWEKNKNKEK